MRLTQITCYALMYIYTCRHTVDIYLEISNMHAALLYYNTYDIVY